MLNNSAESALSGNNKERLRRRLKRKSCYFSTVGLGLNLNIDLRQGMVRYVLVRYLFIIVKVKDRHRVSNYNLMLLTKDTGSIDYKKKIIKINLKIFDPLPKKIIYY